MIVTKIPIYDLLVFLDEKEDTFEKKNNILDFISEHYKSLTNIAPKFSMKHAMETLCFCDSGLIANNNCPFVEGMLLQNSKGEYGITFCGFHNTLTNIANSSALWVWKLNEKGTLFPDVFNLQDWVKWGVMTGLYSYMNYTEGVNCNIGQRDMRRGMVGKDVLILQQHLSSYDADIPLTGEFEEKTENFIKGIQRMHFHYADIDGIVKAKNIDIYLR